MLFVGIALCMTVSTAWGQAPCSAPEYRQFDFWLGTWEVRTPNGQLAGVNRITPVFGGCAIREEYSTPSGFTGGSLSTYDRASGQWQQVWMDSGGLALTLMGKFDDGAMTLSGVATGTNGEAREQRVSWSSQPGGTVRQHWTAQDDSGAWQTVFDGSYTRLDSDGDDPSLAALGWLTGPWEQRSETRVRAEIWARASAGVFRGVGTVHAADGQPRGRESLALVVMAGEIYYLAKTSQHSVPIAFRLTEVAEGRAVFENPAHDFPRRLEYTLTDPNSLTVVVSDGADGGFSIEFSRTAP